MDVRSVMMGSKVKLSWGILDEKIAEHGVEGFEKLVFADITEGRSLQWVCEKYGMMYSVMWEWIRDDGERMDGYQNALKGRADALMGEVVEIADGSGDAKLMVDTRFKLAGKLDSGRFGDTSKVEVKGSVSLIGLLASLKELPQDVIEGESVEVVAEVDALPESLPEHAPVAPQVIDAHEGVEL